VGNESLHETRQERLKIKSDNHVLFVHCWKINKSIVLCSALLQKHSGGVDIMLS
jgi:hypothetical protein